MTTLGVKKTKQRINTQEEEIVESTGVTFGERKGVRPRER